MLNTPFLEDYHTKLAEQVDRFNRQAQDTPPGETEDQQARRLVPALAREGLLVHAVPADFNSGSSVLDVRALCVIREHLSYESALADLMFAMQGLGSFPVSLAGSSELKQRILPRVSSGEAIAAFAITEPEAGSDVGAIQTTARRDRDTYVIDGVKTFISNAGLADFYSVFARTDPEKGSKGISAFLVERDSPGFRFEEKIELISPHPIGRISFAGCRVPATNLLGEEGQGFKIAMAALDGGRIGIAAQAVGIAAGAYELSVAYARERKSFGQPIGQHQMVQWMLADMATSIEAARMLTWRAAWLKDTGAVFGAAAAMAKLWASETAMKVTTDAIQVHGGYGFIKEYQVERYFRDAKITQIYEGTSQIQKLVIARRLLEEASAA